LKLVNEGDLKESTCTTNLYKPFTFSLKPIIFLVLKSWIIQLSVENCTKQEGDFHILKVEMRLILKVGEYKTLVRYKLEEKETLPSCCTKTDELFGRLTLIGLIL